MHDKQAKYERDSVNMNSEYRVYRFEEIYDDCKLQVTDVKKW